MSRRSPLEKGSVILVLSLLSVGVECGWKSWMSGGGGWNEGWESKGVTFGIKSKGMTAIIPFPLPIPIFSKDKGGDSGGGSMKGGDTKGASGGWEP